MVPGFCAEPAIAIRTKRIAKPDHGFTQLFGLSVIVFAFMNPVRESPRTPGFLI
jgi:hypothetical protein